MVGRAERGEMELLPVLVEPAEWEDLELASFQLTPGRPTPLLQFLSEHEQHFKEAMLEVLKALKAKVRCARQRRDGAAATAKKEPVASPVARPPVAPAKPAAPVSSVIPRPRHTKPRFRTWMAGSAAVLAMAAIGTSIWVTCRGLDRTNMARSRESTPSTRAVRSTLSDGHSNGIGPSSGLVVGAAVEGGTLAPVTSKKTTSVSPPTSEELRSVLAATLLPGWEAVVEIPQSLSTSGNWATANTLYARDRDTLFVGGTQGICRVALGTRAVTCDTTLLKSVAGFVGLADGTTVAVGRSYLACSRDGATWKLCGADGGEELAPRAGGGFYVMFTRPPFGGAPPVKVVKRTTARTRNQLRFENAADFPTREVGCFKLYAFPELPGVVFLGCQRRSSNDMIKRSADDAKTWTDVVLPDSKERDRNIHGMFYDTRRHHLAAFVSQGGTYISTDKGARWSYVPPSAAPGEITPTLCQSSRLDRERVWCVSEQGILRSQDGLGFYPLGPMAPSTGIDPCWQKEPAAVQCISPSVRQNAFAVMDSDGKHETAFALVSLSYRLSTTTTRQGGKTSTSTSTSASREYLVRKEFD